MVQIPIRNRNKPTFLKIDFDSIQLYQSLVEIWNSRSEVVLKQNVGMTTSNEFRLPDFNNENTYYMVLIKTVISIITPDALNTYALEVSFIQDKEIICHNSIKGQFEKDKNLGVVAFVGKVYVE